MKLSNCFAIHYRLIYITLWGFLISSFHQVKLLVALNGVMMLLIMLQIALLHQSYRAYGKKWLKYHIFTLLLFMTLSVQIDHAGISIGTQHWQLAMILALRINLLVISLWIAFMNVSEQQLLQAIMRLPLPEKLQQLFILTIHYIAVLSELNHTMGLAMKARGFQAKCERRSFYVFSQRIVLLLIHALNKVEKSQMALKARGFKF